MKWPKLKHPLLCNLVLVGGVIFIFLFALSLPALNTSETIPPYVTGVAMLVMLFGLVGVLFTNVGVLMAVSTVLAMYQGYLHARQFFTCPKNGTRPEKIRKRILRRTRRFGYAYEVRAVPRELVTLRYKNLPSATINYHRIEKLLLVYEADILDDACFRRLWQSANSITDIIDREQKPHYRKPKGYSKQNSVSVAAVVLANTVSPSVAAKLAEDRGSFGDRSVLFCAVELSTAWYYFDNQKEPFLFTYPVKNRALNRIRRVVFGGRVPLRGNPHLLPEPLWMGKNGFDPEASLWSFMRYIRREVGGQSRRDKKRFQQMADRTVILEDGWLYCKLGDRGDMMMIDDVREDFGDRVTDAVTDAVTDVKKKQVLLSLNWSYPKSNRISKKDSEAIRGLVEEFLREQGVEVTFIQPERDR